jgi:hypothetical protein
MMNVINDIYYGRLSVDLIMLCYILSLTEIYSFFSGTLVTCYLLSFGYLVLNPVHFLLTENIKRGNQGILI